MSYSQIVPSVLMPVSAVLHPGSKYSNWTGCLVNGLYAIGSGHTEPIIPIVFWQKRNSQFLNFRLNYDNKKTGIPAFFVVINYACLLYQTVS